LRWGELAALRVSGLDPDGYEEIKVSDAC